MSDASVNLTKMFEARTKEILDKAKPAILRLIKLAETLKMDRAQHDLLASLNGLEKPEFWLIVLGRFKNGKSTFMNILLGRLLKPLPDLPNLKGAVLPMDDLPTTARLTTIRYGETPQAVVVRKAGRDKPRSIKWFIDESGLRPGKAANEAAFKDIEEFELTIPYENGRGGLVLVDCPGTDEDEERTRIALKAINRCDAAIMLFRTDSLLGEGELDFVKDMKAKGLKSYFTVVNRWYDRTTGKGRAVDERLKHNVWDKRVRDLDGGPEYAGHDFAKEKIYFVDALSALDGRMAGDEAKVRESGLEEFEKALATYYEKERRKVHVCRWTDQADVQAVSLEEFIARIIPTLKREQADFQRKFDEIEPRLLDLSAHKTRIPKLFAAFRETCSNKLVTGFEDLINRIRDDLPAYMAGKQLESLKGVSALGAAILPSKQKAAAEEAMTIAKQYVEDRVKQWSRVDPPQFGARQILARPSEDFLEDLKAEVKRTELAFEQLHFDLSGYTPSHSDPKADEDGSWWRRILPSAVGLAFGPDLAVLGATNGWKGFGKGLLVHMGVFLAIAAVASGPIGWAAMIGGWIVAFFVRAIWRGHDLNTEIKEKVVDAMVNGAQDPKTKARYEGLRGEVKKSRPGIEKAVAEMLAKFEKSMSDEFAAEIDQQVHAIEEMRRTNALNREAKAKLLEEYNKAAVEIKAHRATLAEVRRTAQAI